MRRSPPRQQIERGQQILDDQHVAEQRLGHRLVVLAELAPCRGSARARPRPARTAAGAPPLEAIDRNERGAPLGLLLELRDDVDAHLLALDEHRAHALAQHRLDGDVELGRRVDGVGEQIADAPARLLLLHDRARAAREAFVLGVQLVERVATRAPLVQLRRQRLERLAAARQHLLELADARLGALLLIGEVELELLEPLELARVLGRRRARARRAAARCALRPRPAAERACAARRAAATPPAPSPS